MNTKVTIAGVEFKNPVMTASGTFGSGMEYGEFVDLNIELPNYSIFYCLTVYSKGNNRSVQLTRDAISKRLCEVAFTLKMED